MKISEIVNGQLYRHRENPNYGYARAKMVLKSSHPLNGHKYTLVRCEWTTDGGDNFGLIRYFRPCDLIPLEAEK